jgi:hypothetical protein
MSHIGVRRLTDRRTGRQIFRYAARKMSGPLPTVLYKYLPREHADSLVDRGELMFSTLSWFQNLEDPERGDEFEGKHKYFPIGGLEITRTERDGRAHPPITFTSRDQSLHSKAKGSDDIFIYSTSLRPGLTQFGNAAAPAVCVEIYDPAKFLLRLCAVLRRTPKAKVETLISRLLVIGYGFRDAHVNAAIADAGDLRLFVMSPQPPEQFRSELRQQPNGDRIWDHIDDYYETSLAQLFPADQSITEMWERVQTAFFEQRLKWQDP